MHDFQETPFFLSAEEEEDWLAQQRARQEWDEAQATHRYQRGHLPLPEAPASVNVRVQIQGREVQITLRDVDEDRLLARLMTVLERFPVRGR